MNPVLRYALLAVGAYLVGSLSTATFIARRVGGVDIRTVGSGNPGSTNVLRSVGLKWALCTMAVDILKGAVPTLIGLLWAGPAGAYAAGAGAILGHAFSCYLCFKGGKAVATASGVLIVLNPLITLITAAFAIAVMALTRYVSLGSILGVTLYALLAFLFPGRPEGLQWFALGVALLIIVLHRANIGRLCRGKENKVSFARKKE